MIICACTCVLRVGVRNLPQIQNSRKNLPHQIFWIRIVPHSSIYLSNVLIFHTVYNPHTTCTKSQPRAKSQESLHAIMNKGFLVAMLWPANTGVALTKQTEKKERATDIHRRDSFSMLGLDQQLQWKSNKLRDDQPDLGANKKDRQHRCLSFFSGHGFREHIEKRGKGHQKNLNCTEMQRKCCNFFWNRMKIQADLREWRPVVQNGLKKEAHRGYRNPQLLKIQVFVKSYRQC